MLANSENTPNKSLFTQASQTNHKPVVDLQLAFGGFSTKGLKAENQDAFAAIVPEKLDLRAKGAVVAIADGVSSANCAAKASQMSACHFINEYIATPETWSVKKSASQVIGSLNNWLYAQQLVADEQGRLEQWFSTFTALILKGERGHIFHIGDCQVAKINSDGYQVLTKEHASLSGTLNRALGAGSHIDIDITSTNLAQNDILVLTYDKRGVGESGGVYAGPEVGTNNISIENLNLLASSIPVQVVIVLSIAMV